MAEKHLPHQPHRETQNPDVHHETSDINIRGVFAFAAGLAVALVVVSFSVFVLFRYFSSREMHAAAPQYPLAAAEDTRIPPAPRLQTNPRRDLELFRRNEDQILTSYGWVDKNAGVVRIPIDDAMKRVVEGGLPARPPKGETR